MTTAISDGLLSKGLVTDTAVYASAPEHSPDLQDKLGYVTPYFIYKEQLEAHTFDEVTEAAMKDLGTLSVMYDRRWIYEDLASMFTMICIILVLVVEFHMFRWQATFPDDIYYDDTFNFIIKCCISCVCISLAALVTIRYQVVLEKMRLRNVVPKTTGLVINPDPHILRSYLLEVAVLLLHVPPYVDFYQTFSGSDPFRAHCNMWNVVVFLKLYLFFRTMRNHSGFYGQHTNFIANLNGVDSMSVLFNFKMLLKYQPAILLLPLFVTNTLSMASALMIVEHPDPNSGIKSFWDATYVSIITMSTVGYGDYMPNTILGRMIVVTMGIIGGTLLLTLMVAVFCEMAQCSPQEAQVINIVERRQYNKTMRSIAVRVLQMAVKKHILKKKIAHSDPGAKAMLLEVEREMYDAIHEMRVLRKSRPDEITDRDRDDAITNLVIKLTKFMFGGVDTKHQYHLDKPVDSTLVALIQRQQGMEHQLDSLITSLTQAVGGKAAPETS